MKALDFLKSLPHVPMAMHGNKPLVASNSERRRWLQSQSVLINGQKPQPDDEISFPVWQLIFFPKSARRCTMVDPQDERSFFNKTKV